MTPSAKHVGFEVLGGTVTLRCQHCGEVYPLALPAPVAVLGAAGKAFARDHARCRRPAAPRPGRG